LGLNPFEQLIVENSMWNQLGTLFNGNLPVLPILFAAGGLHCIIGTIAAFIATTKGHNFRFWLPVGLIAGTPALIAAWRLAPKNTEN
jgi:hypothetical protein